MTLTTHAIIGAGIVSLAAHNPALGICAAFASHFIIDTIPHINYEVRSTSLHPHGESTHINFDKVFFRDVFYISLDGISGLIIPIILFANPKNFWLIVAGACAGMFPDALQFVYSRFKHEPLTSLQKFHEWIHTIFPYKFNKTWGTISQVLFVIAFFLAVKLL